MRYAANTMEDLKKLLVGYRDNMRVEIESGVAVTAKTVADLRALPTWPDGLVLDIHVDLDPRLSVVRASGLTDPTWPTRHKKQYRAAMAAPRTASPARRCSSR